MLPTAELDYELPRAAIAARAAEPRDSARLLVISRSDPARLEHRHIRDLPELLQPRDLLVFNTSHVLRARLLGHRADSGGRIEGLYLEDATGSSDPERRWQVLLRGKKLRPGLRVELDRPDGRAGDLSLRILGPGEDGPGSWIVAVEGQSAAGPATASDLLESIGATPLPPYILSARRELGLHIADPEDRRRYQTVYAAPGPGRGSVAAPTAGLHFTPELLARLAQRGIERADVVLHVGAGTFRPVETAMVEDHPMHTEWCSLPGPAREAIRRAPGRVIAVGTTSARTLETYARAELDGQGLAPSIPTRLLITPGFRWQWTDGLLTNFHLPRSTLLAMVAALVPGGAPRLLELYRLALREGYRFYSYGDAMLVLP